MIATKEEDAYDEKKPQGIKKEGEEEDEEEGEENFEIELSSAGSTTLRKIAGFTLQKLTENFHQEIFIVLQQYIENGMASGKNELIEPSILVLGIIAGDAGVEIPNLGMIVPFLMQFLQSQYSILRATTLWTLTKFFPWIMTEADGQL